MKFFFAIFFIVIVITGCASFQPRNGMTYQEFRQMSIKSMNGEPKLARRVGNYEIYQMPSSNRDLAPTNPIARALYDPNKDISYVFANGALVDTITANQLNSYSPTNASLPARTSVTAVGSNQAPSSQTSMGAMPPNWEENKAMGGGGEFSYYTEKGGKSIIPNKSITVLSNSQSNGTPHSTLDTYTFDCARKFKTALSTKFYSEPWAKGATGGSSLDRDEESVANPYYTALFNKVCKNQPAISESNPAPLKYSLLFICIDKDNVGNDWPLANTLMELNLNIDKGSFLRAIKSGQFPLYCSYQDNKSISSKVMEQNKTIMVGQKGSIRRFIVKINANTTLGVIGN